MLLLKTKSRLFNAVRWLPVECTLEEGRLQFVPATAPATTNRSGRPGFAASLRRLLPGAPQAAQPPPPPPPRGIPLRAAEAAVLPADEQGHPRLYVVSVSKRTYIFRAADGAAAAADAERLLRDWHWALRSSVHLLKQRTEASLEQDVDDFLQASSASLAALLQAASD